MSFKPADLSGQVGHKCENPCTLPLDLYKKNCIFLLYAGTGVPKSELVGGLRASSKLPLIWSSEDLRRHIHSLYPRVRSFVYMKCNQGKTLDPLPDDIKPADMRNLLGRSGLYIVPTSPLLPKVRQRLTMSLGKNSKFIL